MIHPLTGGIPDFLLHKTKSDLHKTPCGLVGISIGIYGVVCDDLVLFTPYYDLKHSNLKNYLEEEFQVPVIVENEANLPSSAKPPAQSTLKI